MYLFVFLLAACGTEKIVIKPGFDGCVDYDADDPPDEEVRLEKEGKSRLVLHDGVFEPSDAVFDPEISLDGRTIEVFESWTEGVEEDFCFRAWIELKDPPTGGYEVMWYVDDSDSPVEVVEFDVD